MKQATKLLINDFPTAQPNEKLRHRAVFKQFYGSRSRVLVILSS